MPSSDKPTTADIADNAYKDEIAAYYDESERDYEIVMQLNHAMALHYGYWDEGTLTHRQALWNANYQIARHAQVSATDKVLDAGCGVGGTSFFLAQNLGCRVHGISLSQKQIDRALRMREQLGLEALTEFSCADFTRTPFPDASFDVVIGIESILHAPSKEDFLREALRVLKPGGRLIVADYFCRSPANDEERITLHKWGKAWAIRDFINGQAFCDQVKQVGFGRVLLSDVSKQAFPSVKLLHRSSYPGVVISLINSLFGRRLWGQLRHARSGRYQYVAFMQGVWRYTYCLAIKSPVPDHALTFTGYMRSEPPVARFVDQESFGSRFPIWSDRRLSVRNLMKRIMHFYLETGIRNPSRRF